MDNSKVKANNSLHVLKIQEGKIELDGFSLKGVTGYEIKTSSDKPTAELVFKITVSASNMFID